MSLFRLFVVFLFLLSCSRWSFVDFPLIFSYSTDHVPDMQPCILLGMVEARSVNVKTTTTTTMRLLIVHPTIDYDSPLLEPDTKHSTRVYNITVFYFCSAWIFAYWLRAGVLSAMNAIGAQLCDTMNSGGIPRVSTRFSLSVENEKADARRNG